MNKKTKTSFVCTQCGQDYSKWVGKCTNCGEWESVVEFKIPKHKKASPVSAVVASDGEIKTLSQSSAAEAPRVTSSFSEMDRVLGGGVVPGGLVLIGGDPGIGKSTLLLQLMGQWAAQELSTLYISGEESFEQVSLRARRLDVHNTPLQFLPETRIETICAKLDTLAPRVIVIDSIQTMICEELQSAPGSVAQVRESTAMLLRYAKEHNTAVFIVGHVTKEGALAGPRLLEHMVDTVLYFEGDSNYQYRILRSVKNRFGPSGEIALFSMSDHGLQEVSNASEVFLLNETTPQVGTAVVPVLEGSRVLLVELQALVNQSHFGLPQRVASGINQKKLALLIAVLERHSGIILGDNDIFFNVAGGLSITEPAVDIGIAAALISSFENKPLRKGLAFIGELGLGGEIRPVNNMASRIKELSQMAFDKIVLPQPRKNADWEKLETGSQFITIKNINQLRDHLFDN